VLALPAAAMIQSVASEWGRRHEVVVDTTHRRRAKGRSPAKKAGAAKRKRTAGTRRKAGD